MPAAAHWVEFEACGRTEESLAIAAGEKPLDGTHPYEYFSNAPNLGRLWIWVTPGMIVSELRVPAGRVACTGIAVGPHRYLVIGDFYSVVCKIKPERPYCKEPR